MALCVLEATVCRVVVALSAPIAGSLVFLCSPRSITRRRSGSDKLQGYVGSFQLLRVFVGCFHTLRCLEGLGEGKVGDGE